MTPPVPRDPKPPTRMTERSIDHVRRMYADWKETFSSKESGRIADEAGDLCDCIRETMEELGTVSLITPGANGQPLCVFCGYDVAERRSPDAPHPCVCEGAALRARLAAWEEREGE